MILDLLYYFARYPDRDGVLSLFNNGSSSFPEYQCLRDKIEALPGALMPDIKHMIFGQSFDSVKTRIDGLTGTYLYVDYGEIKSSTDNRNRINDSQRLAATIAMKKPATADLVEESIISSIFLERLTRLRALIMAESASRTPAVFGTKSIAQSQGITSVVHQFSSLGWTLMFETESADIMELKQRLASFQV